MGMLLSRFCNATDAAQALAASVARDLRESLTKRERALLTVSGGRSPLPFFAELLRHPLSWQRIDVSLVDERAVPHDHSDSNGRLVCQHLLQAEAKAAQWLPLVPQDASANIHSWELASTAVEMANSNAALFCPSVIILGAGTDGHTASLFPDAPQWRYAATTQQRYVAVQPANAPHARISLSLSALAKQPTCYLWSGGAEKLDVLNRAKALADGICRRQVDDKALSHAGPLALLIAQPNVNLHVFHYDD